jgi:hypothetical protein
MKLSEKIENHPFVEEFYQDSDGYWANLKDEYTWHGCCAVRQDTQTQLLSSLKNEVMTRIAWDKLD